MQIVEPCHVVPVMRHVCQFAILLASRVFVDWWKGSKQQKSKLKTDLLVDLEDWLLGRIFARSMLRFPQKYWLEKVLLHAMLT